MVLAMVYNINSKQQKHLSDYTKTEICICCLHKQKQA